MTTITTRAGKGSPLSWTEVDNNFTNLNNNKLEVTTAASTYVTKANNLSDLANAATSRTNLGLGNVDNTSDDTKNSAVATLTNKRVQLGSSGTATQNFTLTAEAANGTMKLARGNAGATTQDVMTVDANGKTSFPQQLANQVQAWATFNGTTTGTNAPTAGFNISTITRSSDGKYVVAFTNALANANYAVSVNSGIENAFVGLHNDGVVEVVPTVNGFSFVCVNSTGSAFIDQIRISIVVVGA